MSVRLFIGNLPYSASEAELREHLSSVGEPTSVVLPVDRDTGRPRGFAFVDYADRAIAEQAIHRFDQQPFKGRPLAVIVDDLDRCQPKFVVELLEGIQTLYGDTPVTYVVAADSRWIRDCFEEEYKTFLDMPSEAGRPLG